MFLFVKEKEERFLCEAVLTRKHGLSWKTFMGWDYQNNRGICFLLWFVQAKIKNLNKKKLKIRIFQEFLTLLL